MKKTIVPAWQKEYHLQTNNSRQMLDYLIVLDSLNFCFWPESQIGRPNVLKAKDKWSVVYKGKVYSGYYALSISLKRFFEKNSGRDNFSCFAKISFPEFLEIFKGSSHLKSLQFLRRRWFILRLVSRHLLQRYGGNSESLVRQGDKSFSKLIPLFVKIPSFDDFAEYKGKRIFFLKRAQILGCDIMGALNNRGVGNFLDPEYLTAFPDYKLPQVLWHYGIFEYSRDLEAKILNQKEIAAGSKEEVEIRAAIIWAAELLSAELKKMGLRIHPFQVDFLFWNLSKKLDITFPHHLTKTEYY